jgi:hypothetical protein
MGMANWQVKDSELNEMKGIMATHAPLGEDHALRCAGEWLLRVRNGQQAQELPNSPCSVCDGGDGGQAYCPDHGPQTQESPKICTHYWRYRAEIGAMSCDWCGIRRDEVPTSHVIPHTGDEEEITPMLSVAWDKRPVPAEIEDLLEGWTITPEARKDIIESYHRGERYAADKLCGSLMDEEQDLQYRFSRNYVDAFLRARKAKFFSSAKPDEAVEAAEEVLSRYKVALHVSEAPSPELVAGEIVAAVDRIRKQKEKTPEERVTVRADAKGWQVELDSEQWKATFAEKSDASDFRDRLVKIIRAQQEGSRK